MNKSLLTAMLMLTALLASVTAASPQKPSAASQKRAANQSKSALSNRQLLDKGAVKWSCGQNKAFWLSGDFKSDPTLTLYWSGRNYILPRVPTTTGAERFQDSVSGLDLVVLPFKAMLFSNHGTRARLVDECKTPEMIAAIDIDPEPMPLLFTEESSSASAAKHSPSSMSNSASIPTPPNPFHLHPSTPSAAAQ